VSATQVAAAGLALGRPDPGQATAFLVGDLPTTGEALAAAQVTVWAIVLGCLAWSIVAVGRGARPRAAARPRFREGWVLAAGLLILAAGAGHHLAYDPGMAGGTAQEAQSILAR